jgi:hypothetical protein
MDGISFFSLGNDYDGTEGYSIELGSHGQVCSFSFVWPSLKRDYNSPTATPQQIVACIRAHRVMVLPDGEPNYFGRMKMLAEAKRFTVTKITSFYGEGLLGEAPTNDVPSQIITPWAELEAVADFGTTNTSLRLLCPIVVSDVARLLKTK